MKRRGKLMKKVLIAVLTLTMLLAVTANAMAVTFTLPVPCEAIADNQLYKYCASVFEYKGGSDHKIFVSHHVTQTSAVETNRIAAYSDLTKKNDGCKLAPCRFWALPVHVQCNFFW